MTTLVGCRDGSADTPTTTQYTPPPTEPARGIEVTVQPNLRGNDLQYTVSVRNTTDRPVRVLTLSTGMQERLGPEGGVWTIVHRQGPGRGGDEAPPTFEALVVLAGRSVSMKSNGAIAVKPGMSSLRLCVQVEDVPGGVTSLENGAQTQIVVSDPPGPVRLACSEPTPAAPA